MGNVTSKEHEEVLHLFRQNLAEMLDLMLRYTVLEETDCSVKRVRLLHTKLKSFSFNVLQYIATAWVKSCEDFVSMIVPEPTEEQIDFYITKLRDLHIKLPDNGNGLDMHRVVFELNSAQKQEILKNLKTVHYSAHEAKKMGEKKQKTTKTAPSQRPKLQPPPTRYHLV